MGLHISIVKMPGFDEDDRFDFLRRAGDVEFWTTDEIEWISYPDPEEIGLKRPVDFNAARVWVAKNIGPSSNATRLISGLNLMENDASLWMFGSW